MVTMVKWSENILLVERKHRNRGNITESRTKHIYDKSAAYRRWSLTHCHHFSTATSHPASTGGSTVWLCSPAMSPLLRHTIDKPSCIVRATAYNTACAKISQSPRILFGGRGTDELTGSWAIAVAKRCSLAKTRHAHFGCQRVFLSPTKQAERLGRFPESVHNQNRLAASGSLTKVLLVPDWVLYDYFWQQPSVCSSQHFAISITPTTQF